MDSHTTHTNTQWPGLETCRLLEGERGRSEELLPTEGLTALPFPCIIATCIIHDSGKTRIGLQWRRIGKTILKQYGYFSGLMVRRKRVKLKQNSVNKREPM